MAINIIYNELMKSKSFQAFVSRALLADWPVWLATTSTNCCFSQVGNFHIKASFVSIVFGFGKFEAIFCVK